MSSNSTEGFEEYLASQTNHGNDTVLNLIHNLGSAFVYPDRSNIETNRSLWNSYAKEWKKDEKWVKEIAGNKLKENELTCLGDEWSSICDVEEIIQSYLIPYIHQQSIVGEIGSGGGRISKRICPFIKELTCFDISEEMLRVLQNNLSSFPNVYYHFLNSTTFPTNMQLKFDFIYSFDVFVHMDLHTIWKYIQEISKLLKKEGKAFLSTANLLSEDGWDRFSKQTKYSVGGFYFISPDIMNHMLDKAGLRIIMSNIASNNSSNMYLNRDYLVVVEKKDNQL